MLLFGCLAMRGGRISEYGPEGTTAKSRAVRSDRSDAQRVRTAPFGPALHRGSRVSPVTVTPRSAQPAAHPLATRARTSVAGPLDPGSPTKEADPTQNEPLADRSGVLAPAQLNAGRAIPEGAPGIPAQNFPGAAYDAPAADLPEPGALGLFVPGCGNPADRASARLGAEPIAGQRFARRGGPLIYLVIAIEVRSIRS